MDSVNIFMKMKECFNDHSKCKSLVPVGRKKDCLWPLNHADKKTLKEKNEIREIPVISENEIRGAGLQTQTRTMRVKSKPSGQSTSDKQILDLLKEIHDGLKSEVYDMESVRIIKATKIIVDLPAIAIKLQ